MARVTEIWAARPSKQPRRCTTCRADIEVGRPYRYVAKRAGRGGYKLNFCERCHPRGSHLASGRNAELLALWEAFEDADKSTPELAADALEELAEEARGLAEELQESADNITDSFPESETAEMLTEAASAVTDWADLIAETVIIPDEDSPPAEDWADALTGIEDPPALELSYR